MSVLYDCVTLSEEHCNIVVHAAQWVKQSQNDALSSVKDLL